MDVIQELLTISANRFHLSKESLHADDDMFNKLNINSLQAVDLLTEIEDKFAIEIPDYELKGVSTFRQLADKIKIRL